MEGAVLFPLYFKHSEIAQGTLEVVSAGFVDIETDGSAEISSEGSVSLGIGPREQRDERIIVQGLQWPNR